MVAVRSPYMDLCVRRRARPHKPVVRLERARRFDLPIDSFPETIVGLRASHRSREESVEQNPYAAPKADLDVRSARATALEEQAWFAVGTRKLLVMSVLTLGLYTIVWFERQYRFQKRVHRESTMPLARGLFSIFFAGDLFRRIERAARGVGVARGWRAGDMSALFIVSVLMNRILDRVSSKVTIGPASAVLSLVDTALLVVVAYPLVRAQGTLNEVLARTHPGGERNETFTVWNWLVMFIGGALLVMGLIGSLFFGQQ